MREQRRITLSLAHCQSTICLYRGQRKAYKRTVHHQCAHGESHHKKYTEFAANCTIVTNNHRSTVGVPQFILGASHVNDKSGDVVIEEDVWLGAGATILAGVRLGRGCIIGANSLVTKDVPPYAVVAGSPAKIIKKKFNNTQIINHEKTLYAKDERLTPKQLEELDQVYFKGMTTFGTDGISEDDRRIIENTKRKLRFVEPKIL